MAYFLTASSTASIQSYYPDAVGSQSLQSQTLVNKPINIDFVYCFEKTNLSPSTNGGGLKKPAIKFTTVYGEVSWLYDYTASRDSDFVTIQSLDTNGGGGGGSTSPGGSDTTVQLNKGGVFSGDDNLKFVNSNLLVTGSIKVSGSVSASAFTGSFVGDGSGLTGITVTNNVITIPSSSYNISSSIKTIFADATLHDVYLVLPQAPDVTGQEFKIKRTDQTANNVYLFSEVSESIDDETIIQVEWPQSFTVTSDGNQFWLI